MGRLSYDPVMHHFSHPHPLELVQLTNSTQQITPTSPCSCCRLKAIGWIYTCRVCSYVLHISCAQIPQVIQHSFHPDHPLSLLPLPAYPQGFFNCDACGRRGEGFSYHCSACDVDVHTLCASMPLSLSHQAHHHPLVLTFYPPYENKGFSCDICSNLGSNQWLYRCSACEFDAHMSCATAKPKPKPMPMPVHAGNPQFQNDMLQQGFAPNVYVSNHGQGFPQARPGQQGGNGYADQTMQGIIDSATQQSGQSFMQMITGGGTGGGGGGDDSSNVGSFIGQLLSNVSGNDNNN